MFALDVGNTHCFFVGFGAFVSTTSSSLSSTIFLLPTHKLDMGDYNRGLIAPYVFCEQPKDPVIGYVSIDRLKQAILAVLCIASFLMKEMGR